MWGAKECVRALGESRGRTGLHQEGRDESVSQIDTGTIGKILKLFRQMTSIVNLKVEEPVESGLRMKTKCRPQGA